MFYLLYFPRCQILIIANLMIAPHICSPCGHGGCGPCSTISPKYATNLVTKWFEKSDTCPQCRGKLSIENPIVKDYILERIVDKYARSILPLQEMADRELQAQYPHPRVPFPLSPSPRRLSSVSFSPCIPVILFPGAHCSDFLESQRQKKEDLKLAKQIISWADRARELNLPIIPEQQNLTAETIIREESN